MTTWRHALLGVAVVVAACAGPAPSPVRPTPTEAATTSATAPSDTTAPVFLVVTGSIRHSCGSIGGCAYFASIDGPGGNWAAELEVAGGSAGSTELPVAVPPGRYTFSFRSAFVSDAVGNGQRQLGPNDAECSMTIDIVAGQSPRIEAVFDAGSCEIATGG